MVEQRWNTAGTGAGNHKEKEKSILKVYKSSNGKNPYNVDLFFNEMTWLLGAVNICVHFLVICCFIFSISNTNLQNISQAPTISL